MPAAKRKITPRAVAAQVIEQVLVKSRYLDTALTEAQSRLPREQTREAALIQEMAYGTLRWFHQLDAIARQFLDRPLKQKDQDIHALLLLGLYQLRHMRTATHAAVTETVEAAEALKKPWAKNLLNACLRSCLREPERAEAAVAGDACVKYSHPVWLVREIRHNLKRVLKRLDLTARSLIALIEPGSCFAGTLAELAFAADRAVMLSGRRGANSPASMALSPLNFGAYPMSNGLTRLATRFLGEPETLDGAQGLIGAALDAEAADAAGLVTVAYDGIDWDQEVRLLLEERASFSPDALTAMEANLRFAGPETMETRIFGRLTAWQNWVFQRPNAVGEQGALKRYGSGIRPEFDRQRV